MGCYTFASTKCTFCLIFFHVVSYEFAFRRGAVGGCKTADFCVLHFAGRKLYAKNEFLARGKNRNTDDLLIFQESSMQKHFFLVRFQICCPYDFTHIAHMMFSACSELWSPKSENVELSHIRPLEFHFPIMFLLSMLRKRRTVAQRTLGILLLRYV